MNVEERVGRVEEAILIMKDLLVSHNERLDDYFTALNRERVEREESRRDFDFKMNALISSQMLNETEIREVKNSIDGLKEASKSQLGRIENLENK